MTPVEKDPALGLNGALAAALNGERTAAGMTFLQLSEASGISVSTLKRILSSRDRHIDVAVLVALADVFDADPNDLVAAAQTRLLRAPSPRREHDPERIL